ncbi:MAG: 6-carboxytetrahydropterin synthase [Flavobacteriales bacterium]|jgi:6-pyruvoyltetrahydropterin/6-carboxytetrahydropterin synthase|nr:6-pyruvoyl tetrahydrobiopterin synthase [Flavobacteriales bacterium]MDG1917731.1 6-carboxytetrahydropterin synthase [Flavobacteriales bacterium]|tara:strand:+ start:18311 stop:18724 length:414 start_codon:yes stop_codon:yes gene_type:complete
MIYLTRRERFNAAHMLWNENWDEQKNIEVFGKCANRNWHGHNFELFVTVKGEVKQDTGFVINLKDLAKIVNDKVIDKLDHKNLNLDVDFMKGKMASTEVLAIAIWEELDTDITNLGATLHSIKVQETENNFVEYFGK